MSSTGEFSGKTALVTGGSRGIGRAVAKQLAGHGAHVAINYCAQADAARLVLDEIRSSGGTAALAKGDVSSREDVRQIVQITRDELGPIDILVHCAGVASVQSADDVTWEVWKRTMDVNLDGTFNIIYAVKDEMVKRSHHRVGALLCRSLGPAQHPTQCNLSRSDRHRYAAGKHRWQHLEKVN